MVPWALLVLWLVVLLAVLDISVLPQLLVKEMRLVLLVL